MNSVGSNNVPLPTSLKIYCQVRYPSIDVDDDILRNLFRDGALFTIQNNQKCSMSLKCNGEIKYCTAWLNNIEEYCGEYECTSNSNFLKTD
jgi:hypothetical protein